MYSNQSIHSRWKSLLIKSSEPIAISKKLLENNLITSPVILEDDLNTKFLINENSNTRIPSDKTSIKDNTILSETSNNNDLLGNNNFEINLSLDKKNKSSSSEKVMNILQIKKLNMKKVNIKLFSYKKYS